MSWSRLVVGVLGLTALHCSQGAEPTTGLTGMPTTDGPASFGATTGVPTTDMPEPDSSTTVAVTTDDVDETTADATTTAGSSTGPEPATSTGVVEPSCGDGIVDFDEQCDEGPDNGSADGTCLADCQAAHGLLVLMGRGMDPGATARWFPGGAWISDATGLAHQDATVVATPDGAAAVVRRASMQPDQHNELQFAAWAHADEQPFGMYTPVGDFIVSIGRPALVAAADTLTLAFLGTDNKHYSVLRSNDAWASVTPVPAGMVQIQAFGPSPATLASGGSDVYAAYVGDDSKMYYSYRAEPGAMWQASQPAPPLGVAAAISPSVVVDGQGDVVLAYVRQSDGKIAVLKLLTPQNAWTTVTVIADDAITGGPVGLAVTDAGQLAVAWRGFDTQGIYLAVGSAVDQWEPPETVAVPATMTTAPVVVAGALGADLEIFYAVGGMVQQVRRVDGALSAPQNVSDATGVTHVAATRFRRGP